MCPALLRGSSILSFSEMTHGMKSLLGTSSRPSDPSANVPIAMFSLQSVLSSLPEGLSPLQRLCTAGPSTPTKVDMILSSSETEDHRGSHRCWLPGATGTDCFLCRRAIQTVSRGSDWLVMKVTVDSQSRWRLSRVGFALNRPGPASVCAPAAVCVNASALIFLSYVWNYYEQTEKTAFLLSVCLPVHHSLLYLSFRKQTFSILPSKSLYSPPQEKTPPRPPQIPVSAFPTAKNILQ